MFDDIHNGGHNVRIQLLLETSDLTVLTTVQISDQESPFGTLTSVHFLHTVIERRLCGHNRETTVTGQRVTFRDHSGNETAIPVGDDVTTVDDPHEQIFGEFFELLDMIFGGNPTNDSGYADVPVESTSDVPPIPMTYRMAGGVFDAITSAVQGNNLGQLMQRRRPSSFSDRDLNRIRTRQGSYQTSLDAANRAALALGPASRAAITSGS
jgi:hypothetical protein